MVAGSIIRWLLLGAGQRSILAEGGVGSFLLIFFCDLGG